MKCPKLPAEQDGRIWRFVPAPAFPGHRVLSFIALAILTFVLSAAAPAAGADVESGKNHSPIQIFAAPDDASLVLESVKYADTLAPIAEMIGTGGSKWFMVKTASGNVGWIKAGESYPANKIEAHFRSLPKEVSAIHSVGPSATQGRSSGPVAIPVHVSGSKIVVGVMFNNSVSANLLLDTGASRTLISSRIARALRLPSTGSAIAYGIGGYVNMATARLESLRIGEAEMQNLAVSIHDFSPDPSYEGLLGFDFLSRFHMSLDMQKSLLLLTPRNRS